MHDMTRTTRYDTDLAMRILLLGKGSAEVRSFIHSLSARIPNFEFSSDSIHLGPSVRPSVVSGVSSVAPVFFFFFFSFGFNYGTVWSTCYGNSTRFDSIQFKINSNSKIPFPTGTKLALHQLTQLNSSLEKAPTKFAYCLDNSAAERRFAKSPPLATRQLATRTYPASRVESSRVNESVLVSLIESRNQLDTTLFLLLLHETWRD